MNYSDPENVPPVWQVGDVILDRYEVKQVFTGGGMGLVYRVHHRDWNLDLAVKSPRPEFFQTQQHIENFEREAETWVKLGLHPHTVSCYYVRLLGGIPRIFTEFVDGGSLADWIRSRRLYEGGPDRAMERILDMAIQFAWGLHYAHEQGLIHQDVKPGNVLVNTDGTVKVTDFGLAKARALAGEIPMSSAGQSILVTSGGMTPAYCSPEQANGKPLSRKTDIWSWAISVFEMFAGEPPCRYGGQYAEEVFASYLETGAEEDGLPLMPKPLAHLVNDCFQPNPQQRPQDLDALADQLKLIFQEITGNEYQRGAPMSADILADGLNNRAVSLLDLGKENEAKRVFHEALHIHPGHLQATYNLGLSQWRSGEISDREALDRLDQVRQACPGVWTAPYAQGLLHLERLDAESATEALNHAAKLTGDANVLTAMEYGRALLPRSVRVQQSFNRIERVIHVFLTTRGCWAVSNEADRTMRLWDAETGKCAQTFQGHNGIVSAVSMSGSRWALSAGADLKLRLWQMESGSCIRTFGGHTNVIRSVVLSEDARWGLSGSFDHTVRFWDMISGECLHTLVGHTNYVSHVSLSSKCEWALSGSSDKTVKLWNLASGECVRTFEETDEVSAVAFTKDDAWILSATYGNSLRLWDARTGRCLKSLQGHTGSIQAISVTRDGCRAVSISEQDRTLRFWDLNTGRCLRTLESDGANCLWMSADASRALSASHWSPVRLWNLQSLSQRGPEFHAPQLICAVTSAREAIRVRNRYSSFIEESTIALSASRYAEALQTARAARSLPGYAVAKDALDLWNRAGMHSARKALKGAWHVRTLTGHTEDVGAVILSSDSGLAMSSSLEYDGALRLWNVEAGTCIAAFPGHAFSDGFAISRDFRFVLRGGGNTAFAVWEIASGKCIRTFDDDTETVGAHGRSVALSGDGKWAFSDGLDAIKLWEVGTGRCVRAYGGHTDLVASVRLSADEKWLVSGSSDQTARLWDVATGQCIRIFDGHSSTVRAACLSVDGRWVLSGSWDSTMRLWEIETGKCVRTFDGHTAHESAVSLSGDSQWALSASGLWEVASGRRVWAFESASSLFTTAVLSKDARWVLFGTKSGALQLWELDWEFEPVEIVDWDDAARPHLANFLAMHSPHTGELPRDHEPSDSELCRALTRRGNADWTEEEFNGLMRSLACAGYGWLQREGVRQELERMSRERPGE